MQSPVLSRYAVSCAAFALLTGCGGSQPPIGTPSATQQDHASTAYISLYSFGAGHDGRTPKSGLTDYRGALYGTTYSGGMYGMGTIFKISTNGAAKVLYNFHASGDGENPSAALTAMEGLLYGTTVYGGNPGNDGIVFSATTSGVEKILHSFAGYPTRGGANPVASLIGVNGMLYGTTEYGGGSPCNGNGCGTVFSMNPAGDEHVLHGFSSYGNQDGANPIASLTYAKGVLWGTTEHGGGEAIKGRGDAGTVFRIKTTGREKIAYVFVDYPYSSNGCFPQAGLTNVSGTLYGTTSGNGMYGGGTVLGYHHPTRPKLLHSFGSGSDGSSPVAALLNVKGTLYGTTSAGGTYDGGTVFSINPATGVEMVLHSFGSGSDGATPLAGLVDVKGTLYGTTSAAGTYGYGTVYAVTP
jgi:uncharacterized repeat protein (TIGR03803 family)